jgi:hypothetical protein
MVARLATVLRVIALLVFISGCVVALSDGGFNNDKWPGTVLFFWGHRWPDMGS